MNNHHAALNSSTRSINRVNQHKAFRANPSRARHQLNSRPGIFNNLVFLPPSINSCLVNPLYLVNLNAHNLNSVLVELTNLVTLPVNRNYQKLKVNEPLLTLTPFLCFFLSPFHAGVHRTAMDYYRYLWTSLVVSLCLDFIKSESAGRLMNRLLM